MPLYMYIEPIDNQVDIVGGVQAEDYEGWISVASMFL